MADGAIGGTANRRWYGESPVELFIIAVRPVGVFIKVRAAHTSMVHQPVTLWSMHPPPVLGLRERVHYLQALRSGFRKGTLYEHSISLSITPYPHSAALASNTSAASLCCA